VPRATPLPGQFVEAALMTSVTFVELVAVMTFPVPVTVTIYSPVGVPVDAAVELLWQDASAMPIAITRPTAIPKRAKALRLCFLRPPNKNAQRMTSAARIPAKAPNL
jgi:hypothetical protein